MVKSCDFDRFPDGTIGLRGGKQRRRDRILVSSACHQFHLQLWSDGGVYDKRSGQCRCPCINLRRICPRRNCHSSEYRNTHGIGLDFLRAISGAEPACARGQFRQRAQCRFHEQSRSGIFLLFEFPLFLFPLHVQASRILYLQYFMFKRSSFFRSNPNNRRGGHVSRQRMGHLFHRWGI